MEQPIFTGTAFSPELNPYVGKMANRLVRSFTTEQNTDRWALVTEVLGFAAEAEQKLSEQKRRIKQLESLAATDELTGLPNRRGFLEFMKRAVSSARRYGEPHVLAFVDLNDFKKINDQWGHEAGDITLRHVAHIFGNSVRDSDFVARLSGDEFAIILTRCNETDGQDRIARILANLANSSIVVRRIEIRINASAGVVCFDGSEKAAAVVKAADMLMYADKYRR